MASGDSSLMQGILSCAELFGDTPGEYARIALRRFANLASHDDWLSALARLGQAGDPETVFLMSALRWSVQQDSVRDGECDKHVQGAAGRDVSP
jgi:hypothetical protein